MSTVVIVIAVTLVGLAGVVTMTVLTPRGWAPGERPPRKPQEKPEGREFYMYVDFPDGTTRRCLAHPDPVWGFPVTPGLGSPAWEIVEDGS